MLQKQAIPINFAQGLDTKTDPFQVELGKFLALDNMVFTVGDLLKKRNGYLQLPSLPDTTYTYLTTLNNNLTALGQSIAAFNNGSENWVTKGRIHPIDVNVLPVIRNNINQTQCDVAIAPTGLMCVAYTENNGSANAFKYVIADSVTGQNIVAPTPIPVSTGTVSGSPRVFLLGNYFVIVFTNTITATAHLQYIAIPFGNPTTHTANHDIASGYTPSNGLSWDGTVVANNLYIAYDTTAGGQSVKVTYLPVTTAAIGGSPATAVTFAGSIATLMSVSHAIVSNNPIIYVSFYDSSSMNGFTLAVNSSLATLFGPQATIVSQVVDNITSVGLTDPLANGGLLIFTEIDNNYSYDSGIPTHFIQNIAVSSSGTVTGPFAVIRSVGLASKAFIVDNIAYFLAAYQSPFQPTYFLVNSIDSKISAKLAYENGGGYLTLGLPNVVVNGLVAKVPYLFKDLIQSLSNANAAGTSTVGGIYSQTGINLGSFDIEANKIDTVEIASALQFGGGFLWMYDGYLPVEQNFFLWPDSVEVTTSTSGGHLANQQYFYQAVYEWSDNQGNIHRSAGSVPVTVTTTGSNVSTNTINVPTLRLTYKTANPVKITIYRYSTATPVWYEITSISSPLLNNLAVDSVAFVDTQADSSIIGNSILYTTGGVIEDINAPATNIISLFDTRLWMVDAEDRNLLWYSKQVIEATPVEMSDLLTFYIAPTTAAQGSTGPITALAPMDDKLIVFKSNAIYYINGAGPDNTGANNAYSQPIFITATVGCANQQSIVFMPQGLMFQSDKGIWLLGRGLDTQYIGAPVEKYNTSRVQSAVNVPETNQVRFTLDSGTSLMYDYFYGQWGTFSGVPAVSSCIFEGLHTFINDQGSAYTESPGVYLDGSNPVLMSFTTSWINLGGLQGYQRAYFFYLLGQYLSPHTLQLGIAYNYDSAVSQVSTINPINFSPPFGAGDSQTPFGQQFLFGGMTNIEQWRVFLARQRCQAFQITLNEFYDPSLGVAAGAGLTLSGLNIVAGVSKGFRPISSTTSVGGGTNRG